MRHKNDGQALIGDIELGRAAGQNHDLVPGRQCLLDKMPAGPSCCAQDREFHGLVPLLALMTASVASIISAGLEAVKGALHEYFRTSLCAAIVGRDNVCYTGRVGTVIEIAGSPGRDRLQDS